MMLLVNALASAALGGHDMNLFTTTTTAAAEARRLPPFTSAFSTTLTLSTDTAALHMSPDAGLNVAITYETDGTRWKTSYYNGLQQDMHLPEGNFKYYFKNGERTCMTTGPDNEKWKQLQIFPHDLENYEYVGDKTLRNLRVEMWKAITPRNDTDHAGLYFYFDPATNAPVRWTINRERNPVFDAHTDIWIIDYHIFSPGPPPSSTFVAPLACEFALFSPTLSLTARPRGAKKFQRTMANLRGKSNAWSVPEIKVPDSFDWQREGFVGHIRDQGFCGSCWAFSMIATIQSRYAIEQYRRGHEDISIPALSEQQVLDCGNTKISNQCDGGDFDDHALFGFRFSLSKDYGGYLSVVGQCHKAPVFLQVAEWKIVPTHGLTPEQQQLAVKRSLVSEGPLAVLLFTPPEILYYTGGVLNTDVCKNVTSSQLDHALMLSGYGSDQDLPYWRIKNSWSTAWGENGYIRISAHKDCGAVLKLGFPVLSPFAGPKQLTPEDIAERDVLE